jgi:hypothetical protein
MQAGGAFASFGGAVIAASCNAPVTLHNPPPSVPRPHLSMFCVHPQASEHQSPHAAALARMVCRAREQVGMEAGRGAGAQQHRPSAQPAATAPAAAGGSKVRDSPTAADKLTLQLGKLAVSVERRQQQQFQEQQDEVGDDGDAGWEDSDQGKGRYKVRALTSAHWQAAADLSTVMCGTAGCCTSPFPQALSSTALVSCGAACCSSGSKGPQPAFLSPRHERLRQLRAEWCSGSGSRE